MGAGGWLISSAGSQLLVQTNLSQIVMGATFMAITTSLPELITAISAVKSGKVSLAIGDIVGGNAFDTVMIAVADIAYREGSIFEAVSPNVSFLTGISILMTGILLVGFIRREKKGLANIGLESYLILLVYLLGVGVVIFAGDALNY